MGTGSLSGVMKMFCNYIIVIIEELCANTKNR